MSTAPDPAVNRWPRQVRYILGNEAAERFSYYGMKGILALYITNVLMMTKDQAANVIHLFGFVNYFMPLLGAWVSDKFWGRYHTILWISLSYCAGHGVMALSDFVPTIQGKIICLYVGLGLIAFGSGGIKPCVSAFMGDQFKPEQKHLLQKAYAAFYWSINLGSTSAFLLIPWIRKEYGYSWAFGVPGLAMAFATFVFWLGTKHYVRVPPTSKTKSAGFFRVLFFAWKNQQRKQPGEHFWDVARARFSEREVDAARSVLPILSVFALAPVFWALFDQTFSTWVLQGEQMKPYYVGSATLSASQIREPDSLVVKLQSGTNAAAGFLWGQFSANGKQLLSNPSTQRSARQSCLADELNAVIGSGSIFSPDRFETNKLTGEIRVMLAAAPVPETTAYLNRILIERTFPEEIGACYRIGPEEMLSANPILVMLLVPVMTLLIYPALGRFATPLRRMSYGMFLSAFSFVLVAWMQRELDAGVEMSVLWQTVPYVIITIAEVFFSTTGLEFAFREAAPEMKSTIMGFWQLTVAFGNLLVSVVTAVAGRLVGSSEGHVSVTPMMFLFYAGLTFVVAILFSLVTMRYRYQDKAAAEGR